MVVRRFVYCGDGKRIRTTVAHMASVIGQWLSPIVNSVKQEEHSPSEVDSEPLPKVVGLNVLWRPHWLDRGRRNNHPATLQLCVDKKCLIIQLGQVDRFPRVLTNFLKNNAFLFVGVEVRDHASMLREDYNLQCDETQDLRMIALEEFPDYFSSSEPELEELCEKLLGFTLKKPRRDAISDWEAPELRKKQIEFTCHRAYVSCQLGEKLQILGAANM